jgi:predicted 2-oxoglutarate/Fe(II)-dependent dioxygenase YbiX
VGLSVPGTSLSGVRKLLGYASALLSNAVQGQLTQAWAWATFRQAQEAAGTTVTGVSASDMSKMISWVNKTLQARTRFASAATTAEIDSSMIAPYATYVLSPGVALSPHNAIQAQVEVTVTGERTVIPFWTEMTVTGMTKDQVLTALDAAIANLQATTPTTYGSRVLSVTTVTIFSI